MSYGIPYGIHIPPRSAPERGETPIFRRKYHCAECLQMGFYERTMYEESGECQYGHTIWITQNQTLYNFSGVISQQKAMIIREVMALNI